MTGQAGASSARRAFCFLKDANEEIGLQPGVMPPAGAENKRMMLDAKER
jgi:hypothetical protein